MGRKIESENCLFYMVVNLHRLIHAWYSRIGNGPNYIIIQPFIYIHTYKHITYIERSKRVHASIQTFEKCLEMNTLIRVKEYIVFIFIFPQLIIRG